MSKNKILVIPEQIKAHLQGDAFDACMRLQGKAFRDVPGRKTQQVQIGGKSYFIKQHFGVGWGEIFKNIITFKRPILSALTEVAAIQKLDEIGIKTTPLVAYGSRGNNPANIQSFIITKDLGDIITLEDIFLDSPQTNIHAVSRASLITSAAQLAKKLHANGLVHRDFYLCHFVLKKAEFEAGKVDIYLIDLHRMLQGQNPNGETAMKDIAGFYFSALQAGWRDEDLALFKQHYLRQLPGFWAQVAARAQALLSKFNSQKFQNRLQKDRAKLS